MTKSYVPKGWGEGVVREGPGLITKSDLQTPGGLLETGGGGLNRAFMGK